MYNWSDLVYIVSDKALSLEREKKNLLVENERTELNELRHANSDMTRQVSTYSAQVSNLEMNLTSLQQKLAQVCR